MKIRELGTASVNSAAVTLSCSALVACAVFYAWDVASIKKAEMCKRKLDKERDERFARAFSSSRSHLRTRYLQEKSRDGVRENEQKRALIFKKMVSELRTILKPGATVVDIGSGDGSLIKFVGDSLRTTAPKAYDIKLPENHSRYLSTHCMFDDAKSPRSRRSVSLSSFKSFLSTDEMKVQASRSTTDLFRASPQSGLPIHLFDGKRIPEEDNSFDVVTCLFVLHHTGDVQEQLCREMCRVSRRYIVVGEDANEPEFKERNLIHDINGRFRTKAEWNKLWASLGLRVLFQGACVSDWTGLPGPECYFIMEKIDHSEPSPVMVTEPIDNVTLPTASEAPIEIDFDSGNIDDREEVKDDEQHGLVI